MKPDDLPPDADHEIELRWKEEVVYWEGENGYVLDGGWGVEPPVLYVPTAALWDDVVPPWLRGRRAEVLGRLARRSHHVIEETDQYAADDGREVRR